MTATTCTKDLHEINNVALFFLLSLSKLYLLEIRKKPFLYVCGGIRCIGVGTPPIYEFFEPPIKPDAPMEHLPPPKNEAPPTEK